MMADAPALTADCGSCVALCCIMLAFDEGDRFAFSKPAGIPCPKLAGFGCSIHGRLEDEGFSGCAAYDCAGAGQIVAQAIFPGRDWRQEPDLAAPMAEAFRVLRQVQDMRAQLAAADSLPLEPEHLAARDALAERLAPEWSAEVLEAFDLSQARRDFDAFIDSLREELMPEGRG